MCSSDLLAGRRLTIGGPRGSGRSRALRDAEERLLAAGRPVAWTTAGARPYESLAALGVLESTPTPAASRDVDPGPQLQRALAARFAEGLVLLVDGTDRLDRWSARLLADTPGPILGVGPEGQSIPDLTEEELRPLFHGPDRLLHLQEDGARELHARAGGRPSRLAAEVSAWVGAGLAEWSGGRLVVRRADLHRLASGLQVALPHLPEGERRARLAGPLDDVVGWAAMAWPDTTAALLEAVMDVPPWELHVEIDELLELGALRLLPDGRLRAEVPDGRGEWPEERRRTAYRRIAAALPAGNPRRFAHLVSAGDFAEAAAEAQALARRLEDEGQEGLAAGVLVSGLSVARQASGAPGEEALLELLATGALRAQSVAACERALYELGRATRPSERRTMLTRLLRGAVAHWRGRLDEAEAAVETVPEPDTEELGR